MVRGRAGGVLRPGRILDFADQLGLVFAPAPLRTASESRIGRTAPGSRLALELPPGSYLFLLRREGYADARLPVRAPREELLEENVRLVPNSELPPGFVHVPEGWSIIGGQDPYFLQTLPASEKRIASFLISRDEVSFSDYLEFLDARADPGGKALPESDAARRETQRRPDAAKRNVPIDLVAYYTASPTDIAIVERGDDGHWHLIANLREYESAPLFGVSWIAAAEYAYWRALKEGRPYRLPTDEEWERAVRGADGRIFAWGDRMVWSFAWSKNGNYRAKKTPARLAGLSPVDESVFGVRDLTGSLHEFTMGQTKIRRRYYARRGGSWESEDEYEFRADVRHGFHAESASRRNGIRLVCDLPDSGAQSTAQDGADSQPSASSVKSRSQTAPGPGSGPPVPPKRN